MVHTVDRCCCQLAQLVVDAGAVTYLVPLIQSPDAKLKRQVCACLSQVPPVCVPVCLLVGLSCGKEHKTANLELNHFGPSQIAKHSVDLAEVVVEAEVFPKIFTCLKDGDKVTVVGAPIPCECV